MFAELFRPRAVIGEAFARWLAANCSGLTIARFSRETDSLLDIAFHVVGGLNRISGEREDDPLALLFRSDLQRRSGVVVVNSDTVLQYREGTRFVISAETVSSASIEGSFETRDLSEFPEIGAFGLAPLACLEELFGHVIRIALAESGLHVDEQDLNILAERIASIQSIIWGVYRLSDHNGGLAPQVRWFAHLEAMVDQIIRAIDEIPRDADIAEYLLTRSWSFASMPTPDNGISYQPDHDDQCFVETSSLRWGSAELIRDSIEQISVAHRGVHPLGSVNFEDFDESAQSLLRFDGGLPQNVGHFLAFARIRLDIADRNSAFAALTESEYFGSAEERTSQAALSVSARYSLDQVLLGHSPFSRAAVIERTALSFAGGASVELDVAEIDVICASADNHEGGSIVDQANMVEAELRGFTVVARFVDEGEGRAIRLKASRSIKVKDDKIEVEPKVQKLSVRLVLDDAGSVASAVEFTIPVIVFAPENHGIVVSRFGKAQSSRTTKFVGRQSIGIAELVSSGDDDEISDEFQHPFALGDEFDVLVHRGNSSQVMTKCVSDDQVPLVEMVGRPQIALLERWSPEDGERLVAGRVQVEFAADSDVGGQPYSPLISAVMKIPVRTGSADHVDLNSSIGKLEIALQEVVASGDWASSLGQICLSTEHSSSRLQDAVGTSPSDPFLLASDLNELARSRFRGVPRELIFSEQSKRFQDAFRALKIEEIVQHSRRDFGQSRLALSQTSWSSLNTLQVDDLLTAYAELVRLSVEIGDPMGMVWAAYPFSFSVWSLRNDLVLCAVILSPLHPLRIGWLSRVERTLREASNSRDFAATVEGWNLPAVGPALSLGRLLAVPLDPGPNQLFAGWSELVRTGFEQAQPLENFPTASGFALPNSLGSGLNGDAVMRSVNEYLSVHPYISTLTVDLSSSTPVARNSSIDEALLSSVLSDERIAGVVVHDSMRRIGKSPDESLLQSERAAPVTWRPYGHDYRHRLPENVNLRVLEDSGVSVQVLAVKDARSGVLAETPFRRFEVPSSSVERSHETSALSRPILLNLNSGDEYADALNALETSGRRLDPSFVTPEIRMNIAVGSPLVGRSEWTVSGEALISPAALADLIRTGPAGGSAMLWEWNPPVLGRDYRGGKELRGMVEQRSYFSIARVPNPIRKQIREMVELVGDGVGSWTEDDVIKVLGARGVGLSRLLSMGGTHLVGALGFFTAFKILESLEVRSGELFAVPIDFADRFLSAFAGARDRFDATRRRADLLLIHLDGESLRLLPIEVKFYGVESPGSQLPASGSRELRESRDQLAHSMGNLKDVCMRWDELRSGREDAPSDLALAANALSAFVDAAMKLSPSGCRNPLGAALSLRALIGGKSKLTCANPVVMYFKMVEGERECRGSIRVDDPEGRLGLHGEIIADPRVVWRALANQNQSGHPVVHGLHVVFDWALGLGETTSSGGDGSGVLANDSRSPKHPTALDEEKGDGNSSRVEGAVPSDSRGRPDPLESSEVDKEQSRGGSPPSIEAVQPTENSKTKHGVKFSVGHLLGVKGPATADFWPSNTQLNQLNIGVVGDLGTGKTQLLKSLVAQLRSVGSLEQLDCPVSALILDYKRDYQDERFLKVVGGRNLELAGVPLDIFGIRGERTNPKIHQKAMSFVDVIRRIYAGVGPVQVAALASSIRECISSSRHSPTMGQIYESYMQRVNNRPDSVSAILENFVQLGIFSEKTSDLVPLDDLLRNNVCVVALSDLGPDLHSKNAVVALFLNQYYEYMLSQKKWPYQTIAGNQLRMINSYLVVDEATNIMRYGFQVLSDILLQGREFGVGVVLSSQYLSHFSDSDSNYAEPLRSWFIHRVPNVTRQQMTKLGLTGATDEDAVKISRLGIHEMYYSSFGCDGRFVRGTPFFELGASTV